MRDHYTRLKNARAAMISYSSGGTGTAANWPLLAAACAFQAAGYADANTAAQAADLAQVARLAVERALPGWDASRLALPSFVF